MEEVAKQITDRWCENRTNEEDTEELASIIRVKIFERDMIYARNLETVQKQLRSIREDIQKEMLRGKKQEGIGLGRDGTGEVPSVLVHLPEVGQSDSDGKDLVS